MTNLKTFVALFIGATLSYSASSEISVFDAGNLDSSSPYGLTDNEKTFLKNKFKCYARALRRLAERTRRTELKNV